MTAAPARARHRRAHGFIVCGLIGATLSFPVGSNAQMRRGGAWGVAWDKRPSVVVVVPEENPARTQLVIDAVAHWNQVFAELGTPFRLGKVTVTRGSFPDDELARLSNLALGGPGRGGLPDSVRQVPGDIVVALSHGDFISFALRPDRHKGLVGIKSETLAPLTLRNVQRNVIAHELGHALGLAHNADPRMLMCGRPAPCRPGAFASDHDWYFPLNAGDTASLLKMYPATWKPAAAR
jgi:hypothetical protein